MGHELITSLAETDVQTDSLFILNKRASLNDLVNQTYFTSKELKILYRRFKSTTPSALVHRGGGCRILIKLKVDFRYVSWHIFRALSKRVCCPVCGLGFQCNKHFS